MTIKKYKSGISRNDWIIFGIHLFLYFTHLVFFICLVPLQHGQSVHKTERSKLFQVLWQILLIQYSNFYFNSKSILCTKLVGCKLTTFIMMYTTYIPLFFAIVFCEFIVVFKLGMKIICFFIYSFEITLSILYKIKKEKEMEHILFKNVGVSQENRQANHIAKSLEVISQIVTFKSIGDVIIGLEESTILELIVSIFLLVFNTVIFLLLKHTLTNNKLRIMGIVFSILNLFYIIFKLIRSFFYYKGKLFGCYEMFRMIMYIERILLIQFLIYFLYKSKNLQRFLLIHNKFEDRAKIELSD